MREARISMKIVADGNIPFVAECFSSVGEVKVVDAREITPEAVRDADILLVRSVTRVGAELLAGSKVRFVGTATIGFDHIDVDFLRANNICFASAPGSNANSAAEYVIAALLEIGQRDDIDFEDKSIGIIGAGNVGSRVAKKAAALGIKVYLNDPPLQRYKNSHRGPFDLAQGRHREHRVDKELDNALLRIEQLTRKAEFLPIEELFGCDFITLHTPLTFEGIDKTFHLANEKFFKSLKERCVFFNTSRGGVVDSSALKAVIRSGRLRAVVLDVWENEPNIDMELMSEVDIGTPHIAGYSLDGKIAGMIMIYKAACEYFGLEPKYDAEDFLPEPTIRQLKINPPDARRINPKKGREQDVLAGTVQKVYDIRKDDARLRRILEKPAEKRGEFFDGLRKNYPVRREFGNTTVVIATENPSTWLRAGTEVTENKLISKRLLDKLTGIGFKVGNAKS
jgi:erythronate-4-phosphate dehydrogenase